MTVGKLMEAYETCIARLRNSQSNRRKISLKKVAEANFSKEVRLGGLCALKIVPDLFSVLIVIQICTICAHLIHSVHQYQALIEAKKKEIGYKC